MQIPEQNSSATTLSANNFAQNQTAGEQTIAVQNTDDRANTENVTTTDTEEEGQLTIDVYQTPDDIVLLSTIAGVKILDLEVTLNNDLLTIKGSRKNPTEDVKADDYFYQENYWGKFSRSVILPVDVEANKVRAELKDGILKVILPKAIRAKTKRIKVTNGK